MATTFVLTRPDVFVSGTVAAYVKPALGVPASGAPSGSAVSSPSVVGNSVTFTGLADNTQYIAYQGSPDRYVSFRTTPASSVVAETDPVAEADLATHAALTTTAHGGLVPSGLVDAKGDLLTATADNTPARLAAGSNGQVLTAQSGQATGLQWAAASSGAVATDTIWDAKGDLAGGTGADTAAKLTVGSNGQVLVADSSQATGLKWVDRAANPTLVMPLIQSSFPTTVAVGVAFRYYYLRFVAPKTGTLAGIAVWVGVSSGNMEVGVYDCGEASAGNASRLHDSGSIAVPAAGWKEVATPGVALTAGQHFIVVLQPDNATASFGNRTMATNLGNPSTLPTTYAVAAGGLQSKLIGIAGTPGALSMPSTIAEATFADAGTSVIPIPICRMS